MGILEVKLFGWFDTWGKKGWNRKISVLLFHLLFLRKYIDFANLQDKQQTAIRAIWTRKFNSFGEIRPDYLYNYLTKSEKEKWKSHWERTPNSVVVNEYLFSPELTCVYCSEYKAQRQQEFQGSRETEAFQDIWVLEIWRLKRQCSDLVSGQTEHSDKNSSGRGCCKRSWLTALY